jgi:hypothetical protein
MQTRLLKSKRVLLIGAVVIAAGISIAIFANRKRAEPHRVAVENLERMGAVVRYEYNSYNINLFGRRWTLWATTGPPTGVFFGDKSIPRREEFPLLWRSLNDLTTIKQLTLPGLPLSDSDMKQLAPLSQLILLDVSGTNIGDEGLIYLVEHGDLSFLDLSNTRVTDEGLSHLTQLSKLQTLVLDGTSVTDEGIATLAGRVPNVLKSID